MVECILWYGLVLLACLAQTQALLGREYIRVSEAPVSFNINVGFDINELAPIS